VTAAAWRRTPHASRLTARSTKPTRRSAWSSPHRCSLLTTVQHQLFDLGGELCIPGHAAIQAADIDALEHALDGYNDPLPPLKDFILPGGGEAAARCHLARTIVRRAERETVTLSRLESVRPEAIRYLNRLSDLLFVLARVLARASGHGEVLWKHERRTL
jgi:cob(I)alamin adenosyltransferase